MKWVVNNMDKIFFLLVVAALILLAAPSWSSGNDVDVRQSNDMNTATSGDFTNKSRSFGISGSDADINGCRYTWGGLTFQFTKKDKFCQATTLIKLGYVDTGILAICTDTWIKDLYGDLAACQDSLILRYEPVVVDEEPVIVEDDEEYHQEWRDEQMQMQQDYDERIAILEQRANRPKVIKQVEQKPLLSDKQRIALQEVLDES